MIVVLVIVPNQVLLGWKNSLIPLCHSNLYSNTHAHNNNIPLRAQALTHSPLFALDLVPNRKPNANPKPGGRLQCNACRSPFLFFDRLRHVAVVKLREDPTRLEEIADVLLTVHQ